MGGGSGTCRTHFSCVSTLKNMLLVRKNNYMLKNIPWGHKDPAVVVGGVIGSGACTGGGSDTCHTRFGGVSAVKKMLLVKKMRI